MAALKDPLSGNLDRMQIIKDELIELKETYGDPRRTEIIQNYEEFSVEDMIAEEDMVITISHRGYIKRLPLDSYRQQRRGGRGVTGIGVGVGRCPNANGLRLEPPAASVASPVSTETSGGMQRGTAVQASGRM